MVDHINAVNGGAVPARKLNKAYKLPEATRGTDAVQISSDVRKLQQADEVRMEKVMAVKKAIADGTYMTPEKLDKALDSAIDDVVKPE